MTEWEIEGKDLCIVFWGDAWSESDVMEHEIAKECPRVTIGWLLREDDDYITIAADYQFYKKTWSDLTAIPQGMVKEIVRVKKPRRRR